jgi:BlaI family penicillinase repressor
MEKSPTPKPTVMELAILRVLWERGPSTVREVCDVLDSQKSTGYTTVLKLLQIMTVKGMGSCVRGATTGREHEAATRE